MQMPDIAPILKGILDARTRSQSILALNLYLDKNFGHSGLILKKPVVLAVLIGEIVRYYPTSKSGTVSAQARMVSVIGFRFTYCVNHLEHGPMPSVSPCSVARHYKGML